VAPILLIFLRINWPQCMHFYRASAHIQRQISRLIVTRVWSTQWFRFQWSCVTLNLDFKVTGLSEMPSTCVQLTRDLFAIAKFLFYTVQSSSSLYKPREKIKYNRMRSIITCIKHRINRTQFMSSLHIHKRMSVVMNERIKWRQLQCWQHYLSHCSIYYINQSVSQSASQPAGQSGHVDEVLWFFVI